MELLTGTIVRIIDIENTFQLQVGDIGVVEGELLDFGPLTPTMYNVRFRNDPAYVQAITFDQVEIVHTLDVVRSEEYQKGYIDGFEAGGGDVVDHAAKFSREKTTRIPADLQPSDEGGLAQKEQKSPSLDNRKIRLAMSKRRSSHVRSIVPVAIIHDDVVLKINVGVAPHVIDRKHYPDPRCKTQCTLMNTDFCRLKCDEDRLEGLE